MAIKIVEHRKRPAEFAYHFVCDCGCEFWSDGEDMRMSKSLNPWYEIKCPECEQWVRSYERPISKSEIFDN